MSKLNTYPAKSSRSKTSQHLEEGVPVHTSISSSKRKHLKKKNNKKTLSDSWKGEDLICNSAEFVAIKSID